MTRFSGIAGLLALALFLLPSASQAEDGKFKMRLGTEIWPDYEFLDRQPTGPDQAGAESEDTGFVLGRARLNMSGRYYKGNKKGIPCTFFLDILASNLQRIERRHSACDCCDDLHVPFGPLQDPTCMTLPGNLVEEKSESIFSPPRIM